MGKIFEFHLLREVKKKKILHITLRADWGGGPEHVFQLAGNLPDAFESYVACPDDHPYANKFRKLVGPNRLFILPHRKFLLRAFFQLIRFIRKERIDLLHSHGKGAGLYSRLAALLLRIPCVHTFHGLHVERYGTLARAAYRLYERLASCLTSRCIAVSKSEMDKVQAEGLAPQEKISCIPNGVYCPPLAEGNRALDAVRRQNFTAPYPLVSVSRFDYQKNSEFLLEIARELRRRNLELWFRFILIGDGAGRAPLEKAAVDQGLDSLFTFVGTTPTPILFFETALCYISTSRWEGLPLAVLEAMASGLPVVATDVVGNCDAVMPGQTGMLYPEGDATAACDCLYALSQNLDHAASLGLAGRARVLEHFGLRRMADQTATVYHDILSYPDICQT